MAFAAPLLAPLATVASAGVGAVSALSAGAQARCAGGVSSGDPREPRDDLGRECAEGE